MNRDPRINPRAGDVLKGAHGALWKVEAVSPHGVIHVRHKGRPDCFTGERWREHASSLKVVSGEGA